MKVKQELWGEIPLLNVADEEHFEDKLPTIVFFHGHMSAKEHNLHYAYQLANKGMRVLLPDAHLHGEREEGQDAVQLSLRFWEIVLTSIEELNFIHKTANDRGLVSGQIGVGGTSMGGITTFGALSVYPWIRTAAIMMGAPNFVQLANAQIRQFEAKGFKVPLTEEERKKMLSTLGHFDTTKNRAALAKRPIFLWHGEEDTTVPFEPTFNFFKALKEDYADVPENIKFMREKETGHAVSRPGMLAATEWLADHIRE